MRVQLPMDFQIADVNRLSARISAGCWMKSTATGPADSRHYFLAITISRASGIVTETASTTIRLPNSWPLSSHHTRDAAYVYGEEIGMRTTTPVRKEDVQESDREDRLA